MLEVRNLTKMYEKFLAVDNVSFKVNRGEVVGLLGSNGAGKSTIIKMFPRLLVPTSGRVFVNGIEVSKDPYKAKGMIGFLPESPDLYDNLTGREFLEMMGKLRDMAPEPLAEKVDGYERLFELGHQMDSLIGTYSKGMRQKIAFSSALLHDPDCLVLDEPTSGLDPRFGKIVKGLIKEFCTKEKAVLMSTHITTIAESLCDRVLIIHKGEIKVIGTIQEIKEMTSTGTLEDAFVQVVGAKIQG